MARFTTYLRKRPEDIGVRWLLNIAAMTLGEYPAGVPPEFRIPLEPFRSRTDVGRFAERRAPALALTPRRTWRAVASPTISPAMAWLMCSSRRPTRPEARRLFVNLGNGTFEERSKQAGLANQVAALNCNQADYDNDGDLDVILMRGGWEKPFRLSLLRNDGKGEFHRRDRGERAGNSDRLPVSRLGRL